MKLWPESHILHKHHHTVIVSFVSSGNKFWLLMNQVGVNMRPKEETLGSESSFHFCMKMVSDRQ